MYLGELATARLGPLVTRVMSTGDPRNALFHPVDPPRQQPAKAILPEEKCPPTNPTCLAVVQDLYEARWGPM